LTEINVTVFVRDCPHDDDESLCYWHDNSTRHTYQQHTWSNRLWTRFGFRVVLTHMVNFKWLIGSDEVNKKNRHTFSHMHSCFFYWINWEVTVGVIFSVFTRKKRVIFRICLFIVWLLLFCEKSIIISTLFFTLFPPIHI
jgi:hypothetical protein